MSSETAPSPAGIRAAPLQNDLLWSDLQITQDYCDLCRLPGQRYSSVPGYSILRCERCSLIWTDPLLNDRPGFTGEDVYRANELSQKDRFRQQVRTFLGKAGIERQQPGRLRILEIGSGLGFFLDVCEEFGFAAEGCDLADHAVHYANREQVRVRKGTLDTFY